MLSTLGNLKGALGDLSRIERFLRLVGYVRATPEFTGPAGGDRWRLRAAARPVRRRPPAGPNGDRCRRPAGWRQRRGRRDRQAALVTVTSVAVPPGRRPRRRRRHRLVGRRRARGPRRGGDPSRGQGSRPAPACSRRSRSSTARRSRCAGTSTGWSPRQHRSSLPIDLDRVRDGVAAVLAATAGDAGTGSRRWLRITVTAGPAGMADGAPAPMTRRSSSPAPPMAPLGADDVGGRAPVATQRAGRAHRAEDDLLPGERPRPALRHRTRRRRGDLRQHGRQPLRGVWHERLRRARRPAGHPAAQSPAVSPA